MEAVVQSRQKFSNLLIRLVSVPVIFLLLTLAQSHALRTIRYSVVQERVAVEKLRFEVLQFDRLVFQFNNHLKSYVAVKNQESLAALADLDKKIKNSLGQLQINADQVRGINNLPIQIRQQWEAFKVTSDSVVKYRSSGGQEVEDRAERILMSDNQFSSLVALNEKFQSKLIAEDNVLEKKLSQLSQWSTIIELAVVLLLVGLVIFVIARQLRKITINYQSLLGNSRNTTKQLSQALESRDLFLAHINHEVRTPLMAITGFADLLQKEYPQKDHLSEYIQAIKDNTLRLSDLIDNVLEYSESESSRHFTNRESIRVRSFFEEFTEVFVSSAEKSGKTFETHISPEFPEEMSLNKGLLEQILKNLLSNALKFSSRGDKIVLKVSCSGNFYSFEVIDTGVGIPEERHDAIFKAFSQYDNNYSRAYEGAGLGLFVARKITKALHGELELVDSEEGQGAHFRLRLPAIKEDLQGEAVAAEKTDLDSSVHQGQAGLPLQGVKVLLAEDTVENQILVEHYLKETGAELDVAENGKQALDLGRTKSYDVILMDLQMPIMDGFEAVEKLRQAGFENKIIALTAHSQRGEREKCLESGFDEFQTKPVDQKTLIDVLIKSV